MVKEVKLKLPEKILREGMEMNHGECDCFYFGNIGGDASEMSLDEIYKNIENPPKDFAENVTEYISQKVDFEKRSLYFRYFENKGQVSGTAELEKWMRCWGNGELLFLSVPKNTAGAGRINKLFEGLDDGDIGPVLEMVGSGSILFEEDHDGQGLWILRR